MQLEFSFFKEDEDDISHLHSRVDEVSDSLSKVRKRLFAEISSLKKLCKELMQENLDMRAAIDKLSGKEAALTYLEDGCLFKMSVDE